MRTQISKTTVTFAPPVEPGLDELLLDPIIQQLMHSDGVSETHIRDLVSRLPKRKRSHANTER